MNKYFLLVLLLLIASCTSVSQSSKKEPIKIGSILWLSGDYANVGNAMREGVELAEAEINTQGGFQGAPLKVVFEDDSASYLGFAKAVTAAKKLIFEDKVVASLVTAVEDAKTAGPVFEQSKVPLISLYDSNHVLESLGDYIFGIGFSTEKAGERMAEFSYNKLGIKKIAAVYQLDDWSVLIHESFVNKFKELGGEVVELGSYNAEEADYRGLITKFMAQKVQAVYFPFVFNGDLFLKQAKELGFTGVIMAGDTVLAELIQNAGSASEGLYHTQVYVENSDKLDRLRASYKAKYGQDPELVVYTALGYDALYTLFEAMKLANSAEPEAIKTALYQIKGFQGATGIIMFNEKGSAPKEERVWQVQQGKDVLMN